MTPPKVFISYSWKPVVNKQKVLQFAERLSADFVHVILDDWDLKEGQDKHHFMEQMVNNPEVSRVLLICNKDYAEKANSKKGGVGIESLIISDEIYSNADQTKFIPVIFEYDKTGKPCVPTFVHSRIYIDLSSDAVFEDNYEQLLRNIFNKPATKRPPIGTMPAFLDTEEPVYLPTAHMVLTMKNALINEKKNAELYVQEYLDTFITSLPSFSIDIAGLDPTNFDEAVVKKIEDLKILRDDFVFFIETYLTYSITFDADRIHRFFEKLLDYLHNLDENNLPSNSIGYLKADSFRFFYYELFLTFSAIMLQRERYEQLAFILQTPFIGERKSTGEILQKTFSEFRHFVHTLNEHRNKKYQLNRVSVTADTIKQRAGEKYNFDLLKDTDVLLFYISLLFPDTNPYSMSYWFPETSCYRSWRLKVLSKTVSERYFIKVKVLFGVKDKAELIAKVEEIAKRGYDRVYDRNYLIPDISSGLAIKEMCTIK